MNTPVADLADPRGRSSAVAPTLAYWSAWSIGLAAATRLLPGDLIHDISWCVVLAYWLSARWPAPLDTLPPAARIVSGVVAVFATALLAGTLLVQLFDVMNGVWLAPRGTWWRVLPLPLQAMLTTAVLAVLIVPPTVRAAGRSAAWVLGLGILAAGVVEYGADLVDHRRWVNHFIGNSQLAFELIATPLIVAAVALRWARWRALRPGSVRRPVAVSPAMGSALLLVGAVAAGLLFAWRLEYVRSASFADIEFAWMAAGSWLVITALVLIPAPMAWAAWRQTGKRFSRAVDRVFALAVVAAWLFVNFYSEGFLVGRILRDSAAVAIGSAYELRYVPDTQMLEYSGGAGAAAADAPDAVSRGVCAA